MVENNKQNEIIPLTSDMLEVSGCLYSKLKDWIKTEEVLRRLAKSFPLESDNYFTILVKATSLNTLYGTYIMAIQKVAKHLYDYLIELRTGISAQFIDDKLSKVQMGKKIWRLTSFTSKYCHFFIDENRFPMYDEFAAIAIVRHLRLPQNKRWVGNYVEYCKNVKSLLDVSDVEVNYIELDRYLWLAGQWLAWSEEKDVNLEVKSLFEQVAAKSQQNQEHINVLNSLLANS